MNLKETLKLEAINRTKERVALCNWATGAGKFVARIVSDERMKAVGQIRMLDSPYGAALRGFDQS